jgi:hypothetical protein
MAHIFIKFFALSLLLFSAVVSSQESNPSLKRMFSFDQKQRSKECYRKCDQFDLLKERNVRIKVMEMLVNSQLITGEDYYRAAIILLHSQRESKENFVLASLLGQKSVALGYSKAGVITTIAASKYSINEYRADWILYDIEGKLRSKDFINKSSKISKNRNTFRQR